MSGVSTGAGVRLLRGAWLPVLLIVTWQLAMSGPRAAGSSLASPFEIAKASVRMVADGSLLAAAAQTLLATFTGLMLGAVAGVAIGVCLGLSTLLDRLLRLPVEMLRPVPPVALIPVAIIVFGFGYALEVVVIAFGATWPILVMTRNAVAHLEPRLMEVARLLRLSPSQRLRRIVLPAITREVFVGIRVAAGIALILAVTVEITVNPLGIGSALMLASQALNPADMLAYVLWIGVLGVLLNTLMLGLERRLFGGAAASKGKT